MSEEDVFHAERKAIDRKVRNKEETRSDFVAAFETAAGKNVLRYLSVICCGVSSTFVRGDPYESAYLEGRRSIYLTILEQINKSDQDILTESQRALARTL